MIQEVPGVIHCLGNHNQSRDDFAVWPESSDLEKQRTVYERENSGEIGLLCETVLDRFAGAQGQLPPTGAHRRTLNLQRTRCSRGSYHPQTCSELTLVWRQDLWDDCFKCVSVSLHCQVKMKYFAELNVYNFGDNTHLADPSIYKKAHLFYPEVTDIFVRSQYCSCNCHSNAGIGQPCRVLHVCVASLR